MRHIKTFRLPRLGEVESYLASHAHCVKATRQNSGKEIRFKPCPSCGGNSHVTSTDWPAYINTDTGAWTCFKCGSKGGFYHLTKAFGDPIRDAFLEPERKLDYHDDWAHFFSITKRTPLTSGKYKELLDYCHSRGISDKTLDRYKVSSKGPDTVQFPMYSWQNNSWVMVNSRLVKCLNFNEGNTRNWFGMVGGPTHLLLGLHTLSKSSRRAWIFEGQWDMLSGYEIGLTNCFSLPNGVGSGDIANMLRYIPEDFEIMLCVDNDEAGDRYAEKWFYSVGIERLRRVKLPAKDLNEMLVNDPSLTSADIINFAYKRQQKKAWDTLEDYYMEEVKSVKEEVEKHILVDTPYQGLTDKLSGGFFRGYTTALLAAEKAGKTTIVNQIGYHVASRGLKTGIISLEDSVEMQRLKYTMGLRGMTHGDKEKIDFIRRHCRVTRMQGHETTTEEVTGQVKDFLEMGSKFIIVDNLDHISDPGVGLDKSKTFRSLCGLISGTDAHLVCVFQPRKVSLSTWVTRDLTKGYSTIAQDTSNFITINRHPDDEGIRVLTLEISRQLGADFGDESRINLAYEKDANLYYQTRDNIQAVRRLKMVARPSLD